MKSICFIFFFLPLALMGSEPVNKSTFSVSSSGSIYSYKGNKVYKLDNNGSIAWVKNFSGKMNTAHNDTNKITGISFDGIRIYVQSMQGLDAANPYPAIAVMDTLGNILHIRMGLTTFFANGYGLMQSCNGGTWMIFYSGGGFSRKLTLVKVDSTGNQDVSCNSPFITFYSTNFVADYKILPDSSYLILIGSHTNATPSLSLTGLIKMNRFGVLIWSYSYEDSGMSFSVNSPGRMELDSLGNIYVFGNFNKKNQNWTIDDYGLFGLKLDLNGIILFQKEWKGTGIYSIRDLEITSDSLKLMFVTPPSNYAYSQFDYSLNSHCTDTPYTPGFFYTNTSFQYSAPDFGTTTSLFVPTASSVVLNNVQYNYTEYCIVLSGNDNKGIQEELISIFPNPVHNSINIQSNLLSQQSEVDIYDLQGKRIKKINNYISQEEIDISQLTAGMYFITIKTGDFFLSKKFLIQ